MSFGSTGFGGFGQQNQNQTSAFGGFGTNTNTTGGFGTNTNTGAFGSNQNTGTGIFGSTGTGAFGASTTGGFGSAGTSAFGAKPAFGATTSAGTGLFGSTTATAGGSAFGSGGGFGTANNTTTTPFGSGGTSLFGSAANKPAFGTSASTGGLFGSSNNATSGFGTNTGAFGATTNPGIGVNVGDPPGTAAVPFQPFIEKENNTSNQQNSFQNILFMDAYKKWSADELRLADYNQGRRFGNASGTGAFGVGSGFGGFGANNTTPATTNATGGGLFGSGSTTTNAFGSTANNTSTGFGSNTGGLFGAKPAPTGLFGSAATTTTQPASGGLFGTSGGFGSNNTASPFGANASASTNSIFGTNTANQSKPATGFGFGSGSQTTNAFGNTGSTGAFGSGTNTANTGGGLFGNTGANTGTATGGGLFGNTNTQTNTTTNAFGTNTASPFGASNQASGGGLFGQTKPATNGIFGSATNNTAATGQTGTGLFGNTGAAASPFGAQNNTQQTGGGLFGQKPATPATGGGLFGSSLGQAAANTGTGGSLFGSLSQNQQQQQQQQQQSGNSLFGNSMNTQQKPSLFGSTTAPAAGGGLFGQQQNTQQQQAGGGLFGQSTPTQQTQNAGFGNSLFGNSQQGANPMGASQGGLTTSITDAGAYGAPSLFQSLASQEVHNPGPLATPLSVNKKTSRRSSILPLYKMNPSSASKFATPQKRGYGFSYSTFGTPSSVSSTASTPGTLSQSLLVGSVGRGLTKSISSSNLRRTYNPEDSILLPGAFSSNSGPRYYGSTGSKKLVINRDMRSDLFSTPSKVKDSGNSNDSSFESIGGSSRKLTKRVSFDTTIAAAAVPEGEKASDAASNGEADMGYLRPPTRSTNGANSSASNGTSAASTPSREPEMEQVSGGSAVTGKELAIVHEEGSFPERPRCMPDNYKINSKDMGPYWMSPSKEEIEKMNRVQRQQVANFTVGRVNVGEVRFRVPVDLTKINLDDIVGGIVTLVMRSATVYPDVHSKPPVGQGLNVPAEILLLHTCPRSGPDVGPARMKKHIQRLKTIPDTTFVSYDEKTAAWVFRVEHFTTYGLDDDGDETTDAETDADTTVLSTTRPTTHADSESPDQQPQDDTFDFRRRKHVSVPGAFDDDQDMSDDEVLEDAAATPQPSFLSRRSADQGSRAVVPVDMMDQGEDMELSQDGGLYEKEGEAPHSLQLDSAAELDHDNNSLDGSLSYPTLPPSLAVQETPAGVLRARFRALKNASGPLKIQVADGDNWMDMLQKTVSPQKRDRAALRAMDEQSAADAALFRESTARFDKKAAAASRNRPINDTRGFATSIDLMNSLFEKAKAPQAVEPNTIAPAKGFMKWPYKRQSRPADGDEANMDSTEQAFHDSMKPAWTADGSCIVPDLHNLDADNGEPALKRLRVFQLAGADVAEDPLENIWDHKELIDVVVKDGVPVASTSRVPPIKTFVSFCEQANRRRAVKSSALTQQQGTYEQSVWELASILFDPIDNEAPWTEEGRFRRENLAQFWSQLVQNSSMVDSVDRARTLEEKAVMYLACHKTPEACRALVDGKNLKAATLVSLIGTSDAFKKDMREQVDDWQQGDVLAEFNVPLRAIYALLAGSTAVCEGKKGAGVENRLSSVVLSEAFGLDWKQAFGLRLWYGIAAGDSIATAVERYMEDLEQGRVPAPRPWYGDQPGVTVPEGREDLMFGLLKVAAGRARLEDVLEPQNVGPSPFQFRLCWQLNQVLSAVAGSASSIGLPADKADVLTTSYASEVLYQDNANKGGRQSDISESAWVHAIWVVLHLSDRTARARAIQDVLGRHIGLLFRDGSDNNAKIGLYERLVDDLKVPAQWVWQAAALYWRNQANEPVLEAECLLRAAAYADAHRIFVKELAPKAVVGRDYGAIADMLAKLRPYRHEIADWALGGEVYSCFLDLLTIQQGGGSRGTGAAARTRGRQQQARDEAAQASAQLAGAVEALVAALPTMYEKASAAQPTEVAAITEMADVVAKETIALASKGRIDLSKISLLPLTEDRRLRYATDMAFAYYREVMSAS